MQALQFIDSKSLLEMCFTLALVATGMKKGVSMLPFFVVSMPTLALVFLSLWVILNMFMVLIVKGVIKR